MKEWRGWQGKDAGILIGRGSKVALSSNVGSYFLKARYVNHVKTFAAQQNKANSILAPSIHQESSCCLHQHHFKLKAGLINHLRLVGSLFCFMLCQHPLGHLMPN